LIIKKIADAFVTVPEFRFLGKILLGLLLLVIAILIFNGLV